MTTRFAFQLSSTFMCRMKIRALDAASFASLISVFAVNCRSDTTSHSLRSAVWVMPACNDKDGILGQCCPGAMLSKMQLSSPVLERKSSLVYINIELHNHSEEFNLNTTRLIGCVAPTFLVYSPISLSLEIFTFFFLLFSRQKKQYQ